MIGLNMHMKLPENHKKNCAIFDFDSTIVSIETLDFLIAKTAKDQKEVIEKITNLAMSGIMTFAESLKTRFSHIKLTKSDIENLKLEICNYITAGFLEGLRKIEQDFDFYIISGGFSEIIFPVAEKLRVKKQNCFANSFVYKEDKVIGFDETNILSQNGGKPKIVEQILLKNSYARIFMIGDGYTDLEVAKVNSKVTFCGFGMHAARDSVIKEAENFFYNVDELIKFLSSFEN
ncbi:MAG: HAD-IB family phosphatase [Pelagibacterales bacterium]|nr:HAD-IB family phosphatase [Pelagibacterales bacterium]